MRPGFGSEPKLVIDVFESVCLGGNDEMLMRWVNDRLIILGMLV